MNACSYLLLIAILCFAGVPAHSATIYSDPIVDSGGDWTSGAGGSFWNAAAADPFFTTPGSGSGVLAGNESALMGLPGYTMLSGTTTGLDLKPGVYTITGQVGNPNNVPFPSTTRFRLFPGAPFASIDALNGYVISSSTPTPGLGFWETWSKTYVIPNTEPLIGQDLNFIVQNLGSDTNMTFDGPFTITHVPEPASLVLLGMGLIGLALLGIRRRFAR